MSKLLAALARLIGADRTILYAVGARLWTAASGFVTLLFIARYLSGAEQGYYYAFGSVLGLQIFFELGFASVLIQFASHGSVRLVWSSRGYLKGRQRDYVDFLSLARIAMRWYTAVGILMIAVVLPAGLWFFEGSPSSGTVAWRLPWVLLVCAAAVVVGCNSILLLLEGSGRIKEVAALRLSCSIAASLASWLVLLAGEGLYALAAAFLAQAVLNIRFIASRYGLFVASVIRATGGGSVRYARDIFPLHWRAAISWASGFFISQALVPIALRTQGAEAAGQLGFCIAVSGTLTAVATAWITTKVPAFGQLIANGRMVELNSIYGGAFLRSSVLMLAGCFAAYLVCLSIQGAGLDMSGRMLAPTDFALLLGAAFFAHLVSCQALYLRAFKHEPYLLLSLAWGPSVTLCAYLTSAHHGIEGMLVAYVAINALIIFPWSTWIFLTKRAAWT